MNTELRKSLEEAAERFALEKCKRNRIDETYSIYPTFFRHCKEEYFVTAEDVWKEAIKVAKEWLEVKVGNYLGLIHETGLTASTFRTAQLITDFEADMSKLLEDEK